MAGFLNKMVATVGANSKAMMEKAKIKAAISNFEEERLKLVQLLGQKAYDAYKANGVLEMNASMQNFIAEIDKRVASIATQHEQLKKVEEELNLVTGGGQAPAGDVAFCAACGHANRKEAKFCAGCGGATGGGE